MHNENQNKESPAFELHQPILKSIIKSSLYPIKFNYEGWNFNYLFTTDTKKRYMFRSFTVLQCSHQHCVQPVASDVEVVGYL